MISNSSRLPGYWTSKINFFKFCVGVGGHDATNFSHISKDAQEKSTSFDSDVVTGVVGESLNSKLVKNRILLGDSESVTPTHIDAAYSLMNWENLRPYMSVQLWCKPANFEKSLNKDRPWRFPLLHEGATYSDYASCVRPKFDVVRITTGWN